MMVPLAKNLRRKDFGAMMDVSAVQAQSTWQDALEVLETADRYDASAVFFLGGMALRAAPLLRDINARRGSEGRQAVKLGSVLGFPDGGVTTDVKLFEADRLLQVGCDELDCVMNVGLALSGDWESVERELAEVRERTRSITLKVIIETPYLSDEQIATASEIVARIGAEYVKSSTGWPERKTTVENVRLMKQTVGERCRVKAAGGIRDLETLYAMYDAGARIFGISCASAIRLLEQIPE